MNTKLMGAAVMAATALTVSAYPAFRGAATGGTVTPQPADRARSVEVVFVLDTTSSMSGLIDTAKRKIWSIASTMAQAEEQPAIRMGLVAYRDRGDDYVTRVVDLSPDLDAMYAELMRLAAVGGGDAPESVNAALGDAVDRISWSRDQSAYRVLFLVGDAPPHMDYAGERRYPDIVRTAAARGIVVNAIQCGDMAGTRHHWSEIAQLGGGRYMRVDQSGGAFAVATPYDEQIGELSAALDGTRLAYGTDAEREHVAAKQARYALARDDASAAVKARRGVYGATAAGEASLFGERDLVADVEAGRLALDDLDADELPEPLRELEHAGQRAKLAELAARRAELRARIRGLAEERAAFIEREAERSDGAAASLDRRIYDAIREQGADKGLSYEKGPQY